MKRIAVAFLVGGLIGYGLVMLLSSNVHDQAMESAMTGAFIMGPITAILGAIWAFFRRYRSMQPVLAQIPNRKPGPCPIVLIVT